MQKYETPFRNYTVYVSRDEHPIERTQTDWRNSWDLYASRYADEHEAREAAMRALSSGYRHADIVITQRFSQPRTGA